MDKSPALIKAFGQELLDLRLARKLSQEQLGLQASLERAYISRLERGISQPSLTVIVDLGTALGVPASEMLARVENRLNEQNGVLKNDKPGE